MLKLSQRYCPSRKQKGGRKQWPRNVFKWDWECLLRVEDMYMYKCSHKTTGEKWWSSCEEYGERLSGTTYREILWHR